MRIDIESVLRYVETQKDTFKTFGKAVSSSFNEGVIQGLSLVEEYLEQLKKEAK